MEWLHWFLILLQVDGGKVSFFSFVLAQLKQLLQGKNKTEQQNNNVRVINHNSLCTYSETTLTSIASVWVVNVYETSTCAVNTFHVNMHWS